MDRLRLAQQRAALSCALLLGALVCGLLAMHHVAAAVQVGGQAHGSPAAVSVAHEAMTGFEPTSVAQHPDTSAHAAAPADQRPADHTGGHHMLNACVAVLLSAVLLAMSLIAFGLPSGAGTRMRRGRSAVTYTGRGPPFAAPISNRLATLCLLRV
ncbi:DUF6153 family protein [Rhodococcus maanshanensis]|uniref:Uncharacterized protein n=1 Tax=Rhodococcus maanshanensis TaxID=183556 RepID=A0A1H7TRN0_9NOCA|nr:DUF6153 family protein [Rhodococcus maanshanensis]SEL87431.1 hypothetical protein SAMN05444583_11676 [Rhodococcus maanshanensis]